MKYAALFLAVTLAGCAAIEGRVAADSEEILAQAGFKREPLEGPGLPARQLVETAGNYRFADPDFCRCVYVGGAKEYAELQRLRAERVAERDWAMFHASYGNAHSPLVWGAWKPEGLDAIRAPIVTTDTRDGTALH